MAKEEKTVEQIAEEINSAIDDLKTSVKEKANLADLEDRYDKITLKLDKLVDKDGKIIHPDFVTRQQEQLDEISTEMKKLGEYQGSKTKSLPAQIFEKVKSDDFRNKVKTFSGKGEIAGFEMKAANIDTADINAGVIETQTEVGVAAAPWRATPIFDNVNKGTVGAGRDSISWWEETTRTDSAAMVAENAAPAAGSAKTWTKQSMDIKMIKDYTKVSKSALEDFEYITSEVNDLISNGIPRKRETQLLSGTGAGLNLKGITQYAKVFACPANFNKVPHANEGDVLAAAILQVANGNIADANKKGYLSNLVLLNPGDETNIRLIKSAVEGLYIAHPMLSPDGGLLKGVRIATSLDLEAGQFIVGDFSRAKAYLKRNMRISFHYENEDDVLNDLVLVLASERIAGLKVSTPDAFAFVTGTFAAAKALIEQVIG